MLVFTDPERSGDIEALAGAVPAGWALVFRHFGARNAAEMAEKLRLITRRAHVRLLIGADAELAASVGADGVHWPEAKVRAARKWSGRFALSTMSAHTASLLDLPAGSSVQARVLSTVFESESRSAGVAMGALKLRQVAGKTAAPLYGLGGINAQNAACVATSCGLAGVGLA